MILKIDDILVHEIVPNFDHGPTVLQTKHDKNDSLPSTFGVLRVGSRKTDGDSRGRTDVIRALRFLADLDSNEQKEQGVANDADDWL